MTSRVHDKYRSVSQASRAGLHRALDAANLNVEKLASEVKELKEQLDAGGETATIQLDHDESREESQAARP